jgi:hypothetical protein
MIKSLSIILPPSKTQPLDEELQKILKQVSILYLSFAGFFQRSGLLPYSAQLVQLDLKAQQRLHLILKHLMQLLLQYRWRPRL